MHQHHAGHQHLHAELEKRQDDAPETVIQYVYKTAEKTFDGPVGGYTTVNPPPTNPTPISQPQQEDDSDSSNNIPDDSNLNSNSNSDISEPDNSPSPNQKDSQQQQEQAKEQAQEQQREQQQEAAQKSAASAKAAATAASSKEAAQPAQTAETTQDDSDSTTPATEATSTNRKVTAATKSDVQPAATVPPPVATTSSPEAASSPTPVLLGSSATSSPEPSGTSSASDGISGGAKAGIAFGVILGIAAIAALVVLLYRRKKRQQNDAYLQANEEKSVAFGGGIARSQSTVSTRTTATAPRLSLRPVTQFLPELAANGKAAAAAGTGAANPTSMPKNPDNGKENPFGDHAARQPQRISDKVVLPIQNNAAENPFSNQAEAPAPTSLPPNGDTPAPLRIQTPSPEAATAAATGAGVLAGAGATAAAKQDKRDNAPRGLDLSTNRPITPSAHSPAISECSLNSASPGGLPPTNVHRVQLDFKPSMDDELELKAGALVRLLHEYDDGWALCIRLDRSQQGVAPRTCLSARSVKPRPPPGMMNGPPRPASPGMRGPGPQRPSSPGAGHACPSPYGHQPRPMRPNSPQQRSMSPCPYGGGPPRSMSPGPYGGGPQARRGDIPPPGGKPRSNSASDVQSRRNSPPGPSPMNPNMQRVGMREQAVAHPDRPASPIVGRKPVPGQAM